MQSIGSNDTTITDYTENLRQDYFNALLYIVAFSIVAIIFSLITLAIYSNSIFKHFLPFFLTESILLFLLVMAEVIGFVLYLNPSSLKIKGSQEKHNIDNEYGTKAVTADNFSPFITYYNLLEQQLNKYACELIQSPQSIHKLQFFESLDILLRNEIINRKAYNLLNDLRRYRNALVHSLDIDKTVNPTIYKELEDMYELINDIYQNRNNENFHEKICKLYEYANTQGFNETEQNIIAYVSNNPTASISEISEHIGYSKASTTRKLKLLQESGLIQNQRIGKSNNWIVPNKN
jgi:uncharacterized membrane protein